MDVVDGVARLRPEHGPIFAVIGVFDGLHRGHVYLLDHLVREALTRTARPTVITFDHHPDEVLTGSAPPLLLDSDERLERLADAGVQVTVVQHFDDAVRHTTYDAFIDTIMAGTDLAGLLMTPDSRFGFERRGTADSVAVLGAERGFDVVVVDPYALDGAPVSSNEIRAAIGQGNLSTAKRMLGRPVEYRGDARGGVISFDVPMALPPPGSYRARIDGRPGSVEIRDGTVRLDPDSQDGPTRVELST